MSATVPHALELSLTAGPGGAVQVAYLRLGTTKVHKTREVVPGRLLVDYDRRGRAVGVEILGAVSPGEVLAVVDDAHRDDVRAFLRRAMPADLSAA